ncbi:MAG: IS200/IS605 family transposase [Microgenomates group bacterium]
MEARSLNHSVYYHQYHVVWGTKYRRQYLQEYVKKAFEIYVKRVISKYPTIQLIKVNTDIDHVHLQLSIPPNMAVSRVVQKVKQETSKLLKKRFKFIREIYPFEGIWSVGYFSSTIGLNEETVTRYIDSQGKRDKGRQYKLWLP